jgi:hypothetical protein
VSAPLAALHLDTDQGAAPPLVILVVIGLVALLLVFWFTAAEPIEDRAGDREERWYPTEILSCHAVVLPPHRR